MFAKSLSEQDMNSILTVNTTSEVRFFSSSLNLGLALIALYAQIDFLICTVHIRALSAWFDIYGSNINAT